MSCRSTADGSAFTSLARLSLGRHTMVTDPACLSAFHTLRNQYNPQQHGALTQEHYQHLIGKARRRIRSMSELSEARRASLLARLDAAAAHPPLGNDGQIDAGLIHAMNNIGRTVSATDVGIRQFVQTTALSLGEPVAATTQRFRELADQAPRRNRHLLDGFDAAVADSVRGQGLGVEAGTVYAAARLQEEVRATERARAQALPPRIPDLAPLTPEQGYTGVPGVQLTNFGFDPRSGRLEVTDTSAAYRCYRNLNAAEVQQAVAENRLGTYWAARVRGNPDCTYADEHQQVLDGVAPRCPECGEYADIHHSCAPAAPVRAPRRIDRWSTRSRWSRQRVASGDGRQREPRVALPACREFRAAVDAGPVDLTYSDYIFAYPPPEGYGQWGRTYGHVLISRNSDGVLQINTEQMRCSCGRFRSSEEPCAHLQALNDAIRTRLDPPSRRARTPEERERMLAEQQARAEEAAQSDWTRSEDTLAEAQTTWRPDAEVSYSTDTAAFLADYQAAERRWAAKNGEAAKVPYMRSDVMDGLAQPDSGVAFGMEIEFEIPEDVDRAAALRAIARDLHAAGLTYSDRQQYYGASRNRGFHDTHTDDHGVGTWSFEQDCSVNGGELVTPAMYDTPETWEKLALACDIIKRHGGVANKKAGMHVHVGTKPYQGDPAKYAELTRLVTQHEDVLYRVAANPERGTHRGYRWAAPNPPVPPQGYTSVTAARRGRYLALNFNNVNGGDGDHPEFRLFDSSLDPGTMQVHAKVAVATAAAAQRIADQGGTARAKEQVGAHAKRRGSSRRRLTPDELLADTATARSMIDTLFRRRSDKQQFLAVFAKNKWAKAPR